MVILSPSKKVVLITGATDGLGLEAAKKYLKAGFIVVITGRNKQKTQKAVKNIKVSTGDTDDELRYILLDLASLTSVRRAVQDFLTLSLPLHVLVNNAGTTTKTREFTEDTQLVEKTLAVNFVGPLLLTELLLPKLRESAPSRILNVTSSLHEPNPKIPGIPTNFDLDNLDGSKQWEFMYAYKNSKLAVIWHTYLLSERLKGSGVAVNCFCPGFVPGTNLNRDAPFLTRFVVKNFMGKLKSAVTIEKATDDYLLYGSNTELEGVTGKYFRDGKESSSSADSYNLEKGKKVWNVACDIAGLDDTKY
ncbi:hypothetical protein BC936DRAFT_145540 [Jimgerdemannia flammicorona]|uniref:Uncharacterized protein n=1 Tax=Jimgerdemannia flammicorona TaxID=994334 RepID=A0A433D9T5_9FUNG|nr:hypothetical protein BC936DRAFT_145540 [Jimgerdemannia flammicorona]